MELLPGQRPGSHRYVFNKRVWYKRSEEHFVCSKSTGRFRCLASLNINDNGAIIETGIHTDPEPILDSVRRHGFHQELKRLAGQTTDCPNRIFNEVSRRFDDVAIQILPTTGRKMIKRERRLTQPRIPREFQYLGDLLRRYPQIQNIFFGEVRATDGSNAIIFSCPQLLEIMGNANELHIDGTFKSVPALPRASQLLIFHVRKMNVGIAVAFVLTSRRTTVMYRAVWEHLVRLKPTLRQNIRVVISDFERAIILATGQAFPQARIQGCWFHFTRALTRQWKKKVRLNLDILHPASLILRMAWAIALLPANRVPEAIEVVVQHALPLAVEYPRLTRFTDYLRRYWTRLADIVSVYGSPVRTNNVAESCNRLIVPELGGAHPPLFKFLDNLRLIMEDLVIKNRRLDVGLILDREQSKYQAEDDLHIEERQSALINGHINTLEFLQTAMVPRHAQIIILLIEEFGDMFNDIDDMEEDDV